MKVNIISKPEFLDLVYNHTDDLFEKINNPEVFIVKEFYKSSDIKNLRDQAFQWGIETEPSWHPCVDGCPDYHRIHDNYAQAHVKSKMHAYYYHGYYEKNNAIFDFFGEIFDLKNYLAGYEKGTFIKNIPSQNQIARVNFHNYPRGGGHQAEHIDPVSKFTTLQTLVQASQIGVDYTKGGLYAREAPNSDKVYVDEHTAMGDLMILSPGIPHGVEQVDPEAEINYSENSGRWIILPIIINSDYARPDNVKPKEVTAINK